MSQNSLQNDLIVLYEKTREKVRGFQKKTYQSDMGILKEENQTLLECVKETIEKSEKCMQEVAGYVPEYASDMLSQIDSKRKREAAVIDHNMAMVAFFVPLMGKFRVRRRRYLRRQSWRYGIRRCLAAKSDTRMLQVLRMGLKKEFSVILQLLSVRV